MHPIARNVKLTTKKLGDELVVFDEDNGSVHHLNRVAEIVWRSCDGRTDVAGLARIVGRATGVTDASPAVELALEQLSRRGLLAMPIAPANADRRRDRRQALKYLATALAIPMVMTVTAGKARANTVSGICDYACPDGKTVIKGIITRLSHTCNPIGLCPSSSPPPPPPPPPPG
jgi:Coenzyme PQQ synthesis protein D (PqqD)